MIPFNKEKYLAGAKVTYRNGEIPNDIFWANSETYQYIYSLRKRIISIPETLYAEELITHTPEGLVSKEDKDSQWDLVMREEVKVDFKKDISELSDKLDKMKPTFKNDLARVINSYSKENGSDTPDFILAKYMNDCLKAFNKAIQLRTKHYDHGH